MEKDLVRHFFSMVKIDSESGEERDFLLFLKDLFKKELDGESSFDDYGNLIIRIKSKNSQNKEPILFCCHGDTVKPGKGIDPVLEGDIICSKGDTILGADDKAGITEMLVALKKASKYPPVEILVTRREESGLSGSDHLNQNMLESKEGYVLDSEALDEIVIGGPSRMEITIKILGKAAHAVEPENGISAIEIAAHGISLLQTGWIDPETTVNVGLIQGGQVLNAVPDTTLIQMECRSQDHQKCLDRSQIIRDTFLTVVKARGATAEIQMKMGLKASRISESIRVVEIAKRAITSAGLTPHTKVICGGTDASNLNQRGIKTAVLGVGGKLPHSKDEHIALTDMKKAVDILIHLLEEYSGLQSG